MLFLNAVESRTYVTETVTTCNRFSFIYFTIPSHMSQKTGQVEEDPFEELKVLLSWDL